MSCNVQLFNISLHAYTIDTQLQSTRNPQEEWSALASNPPVDVQKFFRRAAKVSYHALAGIVDPEIMLDGQPVLVTATCANEQNMNTVKSALDKLNEEDP